MAQLDFDSTGIDPQAPRDIVPPGKYVAHIVKSDINPTKSGSGKLLNLEFEILDGPHAKQHLWSNVNIINDSEAAQQIGQAQLSAICHAVNVPRLSDSEQLHWKPLAVTVIVIPAGTASKSGYVQEQAKNEVKGYGPVDGFKSAATATAGQRQGGATSGSGGATRPPQAHAPAASKAAPWGRKA